MSSRQEFYKNVTNQILISLIKRNIIQPSRKMSSPTIQNLNKSNNTSQKSSSPMDTASNSLTKPEDNGILNNKTKTTANQLKKNLNQSEESISLTSKASVNNFKEHYPSTT